MSATHDSATDTRIHYSKTASNRLHAEKRVIPMHGKDFNDFFNLRHTLKNLTANKQPTKDNLWTRQKMISP